MFKKTILATLLATNFFAQAEKNISYRYIEAGYNYIDLDNDGHNDSLYLTGAFELSKSFYLGAFFENSDGRFKETDHYGIFLGFHTSLSKRSDFYAEINSGKAETSYSIPFNGTVISSNNKKTVSGFKIGTRTAFNEKFELISTLGYNDLYTNTTLGLTGLFKINKHNNLTFGIENVDGNDFGANIGYRYSF